MVRIEILARRDAPALNDLTLTALKEYPAAFTTDYRQVKNRSARALSDHLAELERSRGFRLGAFDSEGELVGTVRLNPRTGPRLAHCADILFLFVRSDRQKQGIGHRLMLALIDEAREMDGLEQLELAVSRDSTPAIRLYEKVGFEATGVLRRQIRVGDDYHDLIPMWMPF